MELSKALKIDGWMEPPELEWLAVNAAHHKVIVEIGSYKGRSTRALADNTQGLVIAIDNFYGPPEIEIADRDAILNSFTSNLADCHNVVVVNSNHRTLPRPEFTPDMVFIDGGHEYEAVKGDITFWKSFIAVGGLLCGHDYGWCPGVKEAVEELLPAFQVAPSTSIWHVTV